MSNLIEKYGASWFNSKFGQSMFESEGLLCRIDSVSHDHVMVKTFHKDRTPKLRKTKFAQFADSAMFNVPEMGYRTFDKGKWLCYLGRNNTSYHRGLRYRDITRSLSTLTQYLKGQTRVVEPKEDELLQLVYRPNFIPLHTGIKLMLEGKLFSFAASASVAVIPDHESDGLLILMNENVVGRVDENGVMSYTFNYAKEYVEVNA